MPQTRPPTQARTRTLARPVMIAAVVVLALAIGGAQPSTALLSEATAWLGFSSSGYACDSWWARTFHDSADTTVGILSVTYNGAGACNSSPAPSNSQTADSCAKNLGGCQNDGWGGALAGTCVTVTARTVSLLSDVTDTETICT